uniref:Uncharacterized protein n=1 Tax=Rhizophora mucronata TaxID=61149 RepID=A0A2P2QAE2_RHIMU
MKHATCFYKATNHEILNLKAFCHCSSCLIKISMMKAFVSLSPCPGVSVL